MRKALLAETPLGVLFHDLKDNVKELFSEEIGLVKREMTEKISCFSHEAITLAIGGAVAYAGLIVFLGGLGILLGFALQKLDLDPLLANFIGLAAIGFIVIAAGVVMILKAVKGFSSGSLAPRKTIATFKHLKGTEGVEEPQRRVKTREKKPQRSSEELQRAVFATEERIGETLKEVAYRASPARIKDRTVEHIRTHPYQWSLLALAGGLLGSHLVRRKFSRALAGEICRCLRPTKSGGGRSVSSRVLHLPFARQSEG